jgi:hypothetical protein
VEVDGTRGLNTQKRSEACDAGRGRHPSSKQTKRNTHREPGRAANTHHIEEEAGTAARRRGTRKRKNKKPHPDTSQPTKQHTERARTSRNKNNMNKRETSRREPQQQEQGQQEG